MSRNHAIVLGLIAALLVVFAIGLASGLVPAGFVAKAPNQIDESQPPTPGGAVPAASGSSPAGSEDPGSRSPVTSQLHRRLRCKTHLGWFQPAPNAAVRLCLRDTTTAVSPTEQRLRSDATGLLEVLIPMSGQFLVELDSNDSNVLAIPVTAVVPLGASSASLRPVHLHLFPLDHELQGTVTTDVAGEERPIASARVYSFVDRQPPVLTDAQGRFRVRVSSSDPSVNLTVSADGFGYVRERLGRRQAGQTSHVQIRMRPGCRIHGRVTDSNEQPLPGAKVSSLLTHLTGEQATADDKGRYEIRTLPLAGRRHYLWATRSGYAKTTKGLAAGQASLEANLVLRRGATIHGAVYSPEGLPVAGARVAKGYTAELRDGRWDVLTDAKGRFRLRHARRGKDFLSVRMPGFAVWRQPIQVPEDGGVLDLQVHLQPGHRAGGRVTDGQGRPVAGAVLGTSGSRLQIDTRTDAAGRYLLVDLPQQKLTVSLGAMGYQYLRDQPLRLDALDNDFTLHLSLQLRGRVVDDRSGAPIHDFRIRILTWKGTSRMRTSWINKGHLFSGTDGYWDTQGMGLKAGTTFTLEALAKGYAPAVLRDVRLSPDMRRDAVTFRLRPGVRLAGTVTDRDSGLPLVATRVRVMRTDRGRTYYSLRPEMWVQAMTDRQGRFRIDHLAAGEVRLLIRAEPRLPHLHGPIVVPSTGAMPEQQVRVGPGGRVAGILRDEEGRALGGVVVQLEPGGIARDLLRSHSSTKTSDAHGRFEFDALPNAAFVVSARIEDATGTAVYRQRVLVRPQGVTRVDLAMPGSCVVVGTVTAPNGVAPSIVQLNRILSAPGQGLEVYRCKVRGDGFRIRGLPAGQFQVAVFHAAGGRGGVFNLRDRLRIRKGENRIRIDIPASR